MNRIQMLVEYCIKKDLADLVVGELNDDINRKNVVRALQPDDNSFVVCCDKNNNTPDIIDQSKMVVDFYFFDKFTYRATISGKMFNAECEIIKLK